MRKPTNPRIRWFRNRKSHPAAVPLILLGLALAAPAPAATITVDGGTCTLIDAIQAANSDTAAGGCSAGSGADTIELTADVTLTEPFVSDPDFGRTGLPEIASDITIDGDPAGTGARARIERDPTFDCGGPPGDAQRDFRLLRVKSGTLTVRNAILANGCANGEISTFIFPPAGGAILVIPEPSSTASLALVLDNVRLEDNAAGVGGAVYSGNSLMVTDSEFTDNRAFRHDSLVGADNAAGGAIRFVSGVIEITDSGFYNNRAERLGGAGTLDIAGGLIQDVVFEGNEAGRQGGALWAAQTVYPAPAENVPLKLVRCAFLDNRVTESVQWDFDLAGADASDGVLEATGGGGLYAGLGARTSLAPASLWIRDSLFDGNEVVSQFDGDGGIGSSVDQPPPEDPSVGFGGAILYQGDTAPGNPEVLVENSLLHGNRAEAGGGVAVMHFITVENEPPSVPDLVLRNTTLHENIGNASQVFVQKTADVNDTGEVTARPLRVDFEHVTLSGQRPEALPDGETDLLIAMTWGFDDDAVNDDWWQLHFSNTVIHAQVPDPDAGGSAADQILCFEEGFFDFAFNDRVVKHWINEDGNVIWDASDAENGGIGLAFACEPGPTGPMDAADFRDPKFTAAGPQDNGGPVPTLALLPGSGAIDFALDGNCPFTDARGEPRGVDGDGTVDSPEVGDCDAGAFERQPGDPESWLQIDDAVAAEGDSGTTPFAFPVSLSDPLGDDVAVDVSTADGSATAADGDYTPLIDTVTFMPGDPLATDVVVDVNGDTAFEGDESFFLDIEDVTTTANVALLRARAEGAIVDDEPAGLGLDRTRLDFGNVTVGDSSAPQTLTLTSTGPAPLEVFQVTLTGPAAGEYALTDGCTGSVLNPGQTCPIEIVFAPQQTGSALADVAIESNAPTSPDGARLVGSGLSTDGVFVDSFE